MKQQAVYLFVLVVPELLVSAGAALVIAVEYRVLNPNRHSVSIIVKLIRDSVYALLMVIIFTGVMLLRRLDN
jgi:hypothetical protein